MLALAQITLLRGIARRLGVPEAEDVEDFAPLGMRHVDDYLALWRGEDQEEPDPENLLDMLTGGLG